MLNARVQSLGKFTNGEAIDTRPFAVTAFSEGEPLNCGRSGFAVVGRLLTMQSNQVALIFSDVRRLGRFVDAP